MRGGHGHVGQATLYGEPVSACALETIIAGACNVAES